MSPVHLTLLIALMGVVWWLGRALPLPPARRRLVLACRVAAIGALCLALWGGARRHTHDVVRRLIYVVDASASMDGSQREWMARRIASLESLRPAPIERTLVAFGADAQVVVPFGRERLTDPAAIQRALAQAPVSAEATNLEHALLSTLTLVPPHHPTSVVLLSDGRETAGNVAGVLGAMRRLGVEVFPSAPPVAGPAKTAWDTLTVPPTVRRGSSVTLQAVFFNPDPRRIKQAEATITLEGVPIKRQRVTIGPGWHVARFSVPALHRGTMALEVFLQIPEDGVAERRTAYTEVEGPPQVLLVMDRTASLPALAGALKRREMDLALVRPGDLPETPQGLLEHDAVLLFNVPKSSLNAAQVQALRAYLEQFGGGLVMVGLGGDLAQEITHPAPLDALLPVTYEAKGLQEAKRRVCMVMLIDRSASMLGPRIAATKRGAVELVKQLQPEDLVGILAFDTQPYVIAEVEQAGQLDRTLVEKLVRLKSSGGTDVYPALQAAANRLNLTDATLKHILLLSDGNTPFHDLEYRELTASFKRAGITVSTIGIGSVFVNTEFMEWLAASTGGTFYTLNRLDDLPHLIARDTQRALGRLPFTEGEFRPVRSPASDWFAETPEWPTLRGYFTTTAKPAAQVDLTVRGGDADDPLLARWSVGRGRVAAFTSDADTRWSPNWIRWPGFEATWAGIVRWTLRPRMSEEVFVWVDESRPVPQLVVEGQLHDPRGVLLAVQGSQTRPLSLVQTGPWRWEASMEQLPSGWYQVSVESQEDNATLYARRWVQFGASRAATEATGQVPREDLLRTIAQASGGVYDMPDRALLPPTTTATTTEPLLHWWLPLAILLLLAEIALRGHSML